MKYLLTICTFGKIKCIERKTSHSVANIKCRGIHGLHILKGSNFRLRNFPSVPSNQSTNYKS